MTRLKVLYLAQHLTMGGAEELLLGVATHLPRDRFEVVVGCLTRQGVIADEMLRSGVRVVPLPGEPGPRDPGALIRLLRFVQVEQPDVVHTFLLSAGLYGRLAAWLAGVPIIFHAEQNMYLRRSGRHLLFERFLANRTTRIVACCRAVSDFYQQQIGPDPNRLETIYNAVDFNAVEPRTDREAARLELGVAPDEIALGCVGRLTEQKGHDVLLEALAELRARRPDLKLRLLLAGQGPRREALADQVSRLDLRRQVKFLGLRRDRDTLYAALDVFVLPSRWEGLSLALVEAAGVGLPIVATAVGGNGEVIEPGTGAWLVPPQQPADLAAALAAAIEQPARVARPEVRARFGIERHVALLEASYRRAAGPSPLSGRQQVAPRDGR